MRNFNWETLPKHTVIGKHNIWTADKTDGEYELDTDHMEELFSHKQAQQQIKALNRQSLRGLPSSATAGEMISVLSSKRSMNIGIFLKQFKRPIKDMIEDIKSGNGLGFGTGKLQELCKMLPDEGEVKQLVNFKGDMSALPEADQFMLLLVNIPSYEERLSCLVLKEEFFPLMDEVKEFIRTLTTAGSELLDCDNLHAVIRLVLKTGNYMNAGGYAGNAVGFKMSSLLKLVDTKANKPGMNLMHYVVMQAQKVDTALLKFPEQLKHIEAAARIHQGDIEGEYRKQVKKVQDAKANTLKQEDLKAQMEDFLMEAEVCLKEVETDLQELQSVSDSVAQYFCEDAKNFKLEECCSIFNSFCERFLRATQENKARETAEVKRRHRDRLEIAAKRRSTATCSSRDKEMDSVALESVLQNFVTKRGSRRRAGKPSSTRGSPTNGSPNNGSLSEITSQANLPPVNQKILASIRAKDMGRKEWSSAVELTENSRNSHNAQSDIEDKMAESENSHEEEMKTPKEEDSRGLRNPAKRTASITTPVRSFDDNEEDLQDNNEEEAQKLREASKKVLRFQNSRGSVSSGDYSLENQKSPTPNAPIRRQLTFDEEADRYPDDPSNEDLLQVLLNPQPSPKRNLGRRYTLPTKVPKTEAGESNRWTELLVRTPNHVAQEKETMPQREGAGHPPSKPVFDYSDISHNLKQSGAQDTNATSAENTTKPPVSSAAVMQPTDNDVQITSDTVPASSKPVVFKTETTGLFFSFLKRLGDMSKLQSSKDTVNKPTGSGV